MTTHPLWECMENGVNRLLAQREDTLTLHISTGQKMMEASTHTLVLHMNN